MCGVRLDATLLEGYTGSLPPWLPMRFRHSSFCAPRALSGNMDTCAIPLEHPSWPSSAWRYLSALQLRFQAACPTPFGCCLCRALHVHDLSDAQFKGISCFPKTEHGAVAGVILFFTCAARLLALGYGGRQRHIRPS